MTYNTVLGHSSDGPKAFMPSIARGAEPCGFQPGKTRAIYLAALWATQLSMSVPMVVSTTQAQAANAWSVAVFEASANADGPHHASVSTQEMVRSLKSSGLPISAVAEFVRVERKTVYSWLDDGIEANVTNFTRLQTVHSLFAAEPDGYLRFYHRFFERNLSNGMNLRALLSGPEIDVSLVMVALTELRPAVARAFEAYASRQQADAPTHAAAALLTLHLKAGS